MKRRQFFKWSAITLAALQHWTISRPVAATRNIPNIILIMADDFGYECLGCNGGLDYQTPFLNSLAADGVRFTHCFSQPVCTPSRVQIMTGRYNHRNYIGFGLLDPKEITFGNMLEGANYSTCISGKWQLGRDRSLVSHFGFDEYCLWWLETRSERYHEPGELIQNGDVRTGQPGEYGPDIVSDFLLDFITRKRNDTFFCYYPMILPHDPFVPTPLSKDLKSKNKKANFQDMVYYVDHVVGKIVTLLDRLQLREKTLLIFTGDNGTSRAITSNTVSGQVTGGKSFMTDAGTHVPLIANWPGTAGSGIVCEDLIDFSDFFPTLAEVSGASMPNDRVFDGRSFLPQILGKSGIPREWVFSHYWERGRVKAEAKEFIRTKHWKLYDDGRIFDLAKDPLEQTPKVDLSADEKAMMEKLEISRKTLHANK